MKRISSILLSIVVLVSIVLVNPIVVKAASQYSGGLLDGETIQIGKAVGQSTTSVIQMTDDDISTSYLLNNGNLAWYNFASPVDISAVVTKFTNSVAVEFYDENNNLLQRYELLNNDGVQMLPTPVQGVSTVALKYTGTSARVYEWNVFTTPLTAPSPTTITWIQSGDRVVDLDWTEIGGESYNVKRATSSGGPYTLIANVKGTSYTDNTVTNGTTYYYVVSAMNQAGESANSPERNTKPEATQYTGGLLDGVTLQLGKSITSPTGTVREVTDNDTSTSKLLNSDNFVWYNFASPVDISAVVAKFTNTVAVEFYDNNNNLLQRYELLSNDGVQMLPTPVQGVSTVALKYTGTSARVYEWNVFAAPVNAPSPTTITWIQGGDSLVNLDWTSTGAESYNVKRATSSGGPYAVIANVTGTSFRDTTVTNDTTYYYVVSAVNQAGESANSPEKNSTPKATQYTGGLLDGVTLQLGKLITSPTGIVREVTDNDISSSKLLNSNNFIWYTFASPVEVSAVIAKYNNPVVVEFYDADNNLLLRHELSSNDQVETLPAPVQDVSTVALKYTGTSSRIYEWNVFGKGGELPPEISFNLIATGGNQNVVLNWNSLNSAVASFDISRSTVSGGPYTQIGSVTGSTYSYTDSNVSNGTTYYYIVTAVTASGGTIDSNEASATPNGENPSVPPVQDGERALLRLILINGIDREYDLSMAEVSAFISWYEGRANGVGTMMYAIDKHANNKGPFVNRKDYVFYDKIITFEVNAYNTGTNVYEPGAY